VKKRSITIRGHRTSVALESLFWQGLEAAAREEQSSLAELVTRIDAERSTGLGSAIRVWLYARARGETKA
jgi:predicted DNA-binding ribbon-helix-helix protein